MQKPIIVCLCGSTRFYKAYAKAQLEETLAGRIVLTVGSTTQSDGELMASAENSEEMKAKIKVAQELHFHKIEMADEILVLNVGGYVGESTKDEIEFARMLGKKIRWLEYSVPTWKKVLNRMRNVL